MEPRSILILEPEAGAGRELAHALHEVDPNWSVAATDAVVAMSVLRDGGVDAVVPIAADEGTTNALIDWIRDQFPAIPHEVFRMRPGEPLAGAATELAARISRSFVLGGLRRDPDLIEIAAGLGRIPVVKPVYEAVCRALALEMAAADPGSGLSSVARLVEQDPGLAVQVLRLANALQPSGAPSPAGLPEAAARLGAGRVASLLLGVGAGDLICASDAAPGVAEIDWRAAVAVAQMSRRIAVYEGMAGRQVDAAYLAGLLHNVGRLALAVNLPLQFAAVQWPHPAADRLALEREVFGAAHSELAAVLVGLWGLDDEVGEAVGFYAEPIQGATKVLGPLAAVHGAAVMCGQGGLDWDKEFLLESGLTDRIGQWSQLGAMERPLASAG